MLVKFKYQHKCRNIKLAFLAVRSERRNAFAPLYTVYSPGILGDLQVRGLLFHHQIQEGQGGPVLQELHLYLHHLEVQLAQEDLALHLSLTPPTRQRTSQTYSEAWSRLHCSENLALHTYVTSEVQSVAVQYVYTVNWI